MIPYYSALKDDLDVYPVDRWSGSDGVAFVHDPPSFYGLTEEHAEGWKP